MKLLLVSMLFLPLFAKDIQIKVTNIDITLGGDIRIALFNSKEEFPKGKPLKTEIISTDKNEKIVNFRELQDSDYAVALFHDQNRDGKMEKNFLGIPQEGYGISNKAKPFFGPPSFEDAKFSGNSDSIEMKY